MSSTSPSGIRKRLESGAAETTAPATGSIDLWRAASFSYSSEDPMHPLENILDDQAGPGGTYWAGGRENEVERIDLQFDTPQSLSRLIYEVEELSAVRTQQVRVEISQDAGASFRTVLVQQFNFSPQGATFEREDVRLHEVGATNLRLTFTPHYDGNGRAKLTRLQLFS